MNSMQTVSELNLRDCEGLKVEPLPLHIKRRKVDVRASDQVRYFWHVPPEGGSKEDPGHEGEITSDKWLGNIAKRGRSGHLCWDGCPCDSDPNKQQKMNEWINGDKKTATVFWGAAWTQNVCKSHRFLVSWFSLFYMMMVSSSSYCRF